MNSNDYTQIFLEAVKNEKDFHEVLGILNERTSSNIWLIGGFVYRNIAKVLYGTPKPKIDLDFIIEKFDRNITFPEKWTKIFNHYNNPKFIRMDGLEVDFVPLDNVNSILRRKLKPTINNYLTGTSLTIQSIAYDIRNNRIIGPIGIKAIKNKTIAINNKEQAKIYANKKGKSISEIIQQKAKELEFLPL